MIDLLSPVGDFDCLKSAVQNGANSVYFGANLFSARAFASNFDLKGLEKAITYSKSRGVKTNLTLNTLVTDSEFNDAFELAKKAYEFGIDAIIVQDLGLAKALIKEFPDLPIHASTQMTIHNLQGVLEMQELGFKRVVLARELSIQEIEYICKNSDIEIECFVHGALCISYSGQCLFSSMVGGRSGNRGKCAQPCRMLYKLINEENSSKSEVLDKGYLLSTRDLCGLDYIPQLINAGVDCLKIEGRMKNPYYVATVTRIYRKYIDLAESNKKYEVDEKDRKELMQAFNRGMSSTGHLSPEPNPDLVFKEKPNNMGLYLGKVQNYNKNKGHITVKLQEPIQVGDTVSLERENGTYNVSEVMIKSKNVTETEVGQTVVIGRMKGKINLGDKIYKMSSKKLNEIANESISSEHIKIPLKCNITIKKDTPISIKVTLDTECKKFKNESYKIAHDLEPYSNLDIEYNLTTVPMIAKNKPLDKETVLAQITKTTDTIFEFTNINIDLDDGLFLPISNLNSLRRKSLEMAEHYAVSNIKRDLNKNEFEAISSKYVSTLKKISANKETSQISVLLNILNLDYDYSVLTGFKNIYIPLKYFIDKKYSNIIKQLQKNFEIYIYMPTIIKANYRNIFHSNIENTLQSFDIKGFVISNISNLKLIDSILTSKDEKIQPDKTVQNKDFKIIANYTFNVFNLHTANELKKLEIDRFTISPESNKEIIKNLCDSVLSSELIVYGNTPVMNINYCVLGKTNRCYPTCDSKCIQNGKYYLEDKFNAKYRVMQDNIQTVSTIYNSKITSIPSRKFRPDCIRIDILDENPSDINSIVQTAKNGTYLQGNQYTTANLKREL